MNVANRHYFKISNKGWIFNSISIVLQSGVSTRLNFFEFLSRTQPGGNT